jgi:hypothetical protein
MSVMSSEKKEMIFRELTWFCLGTTGRRCRARRQDCSPRFARRLAAIAQGNAGDVNRSTERVVLHMGSTLNCDESRFLLARILVAPCRWTSTGGRFSMGEPECLIVTVNLCGLDAACSAQLSAEKARDDNNGNINSTGRDGREMAVVRCGALRLPIAGLTRFRLIASRNRPNAAGWYLNLDCHALHSSIGLSFMPAHSECTGPSPHRCC